MFEAAAVRAALRVLRCLGRAGLALLVLAAASCGAPGPGGGWTTVETVASAPTQIASSTVLPRHESDGSAAAMVATEQADEDPDGHPGLDVVIAAARWQAPGCRDGACGCPGPTGVGSSHVGLRAQAARGPPA